MGVLSHLIKKSAGAADAMAPAARAGSSYAKFQDAVPPGPQSVIDVVAPTGTPEVVPQAVPDSGYLPQIPLAGVDVYDLPVGPSASQVPDSGNPFPPPMPVSAYPQNPNRLPQSAREMEIRELIRQQRRDMRSQTVPPEPARFRDEAFRAMRRGQP